MSHPVRNLGTSGFTITRVGLGAWAIGGGDWAWGWGPQDDADSIAAMHRALELGVNWIDTAASYGLGRSEEVVGRFLRVRNEEFDGDTGGPVHHVERVGIDGQEGTDDGQGISLQKVKQKPLTLSENTVKVATY